MMVYIYAFIVLVIIGACAQYETIIEQYTYEVDDEF